MSRCRAPVRLHPEERVVRRDADDWRDADDCCRSAIGVVRHACRNHCRRADPRKPGDPHRDLPHPGFSTLALACDVRRRRRRTRRSDPASTRGRNLWRCGVDGAFLVPCAPDRRTTSRAGWRHAATDRSSRSRSSGCFVFPGDARTAMGRPRRHPAWSKRGRRRRNALPATRSGPSSRGHRARRFGWRHLGAPFGAGRFARVRGAVAGVSPSRGTAAQPGKHPSRVLRERRPMDAYPELAAESFPGRLGSLP
jgi:hypothetical protein